MADFTEEILKRKIDTDAQLVSELAGIKSALEGSESGGGAGLIVRLTNNNGTITTDKTAGEIKEAIENGQNVYVLDGPTYMIFVSFSVGITGCTLRTGEYYLTAEELTDYMTTLME